MAFYPVSSGIGSLPSAVSTVLSTRAHREAVPCGWEKPSGSGQQNHGLSEVHILIPGTHGCVTWPGKRDFADMKKWRTLRGNDYPGLPGQSQYNHKDPCKVQKGDVRWKDIWETRGLWRWKKGLEAKECWQPEEVAKLKEMGSSPGAPEKHAPCPCLLSSPRGAFWTCLTSELQDSKCCFKPLILW